MLMLALSLFLACDGGSSNVGDGGTTDTGDTGEPEEDTICPTINHTPIETAQPLGEPVTISATVTDNDSGVFIVRVYYRKETAASWKDFSLVAGGEDTWTGDIPGEEVGSGGMRYYIEAVDQKQNTCTAPQRGEEDPYSFRVDGG